MNLKDMLGYDFKRSDGKREEAKAKQDKVVLELICLGYEEFIAKQNEDTDYPVIPTEITDRYNPTKEQILEFSRALVNYKDLNEFLWATSHYLTALMHSSKDTEFEIDLTELNKAGKTLDWLGCFLQGKKLTLKGNAGDNFGAYAKNSNIIVNGNAKDNVGEAAQNSQIIVDGNAGDSVGNEALNSNITINGNAGDLVGWDAKNCKIYIKGSYAALSGEIGEGTEIYQTQNGNWNRVYPK